MGTVEAGVLRLNRGIHSLAVRRHIDADTSPIAFRQPFALQAGPRLAGILRSIKSPTGPVDRSIGAPGRAPRVPRAREQQTGVGRTDRQVGYANFRSLIKNLGPMHSPIGGFEDATLRVGCVSVPESTNIDDTGVLWIDHDPANLACFLQSHVNPRSATVNGPVYALSGGEGGTNCGLTGSGITRIHIY